MVDKTEIRRTFEFEGREDEGVGGHDCMLNRNPAERERGSITGRRKGHQTFSAGPVSKGIKRMTD